VAHHGSAGFDLAHQLGERGLGLAFGALEATSDELRPAVLPTGEHSQPPAVVGFGTHAVQNNASVSKSLWKISASFLRIRTNIRANLRQLD
jgi:hypothetical protein